MTIAPTRHLAFISLMRIIAGCAARGPSAEPKPPFAPATRPVVVAHLGGALEVRENTLRNLVTVATFRHHISCPVD